MPHGRKALQIGALLASTFLLGPVAVEAQQTETQSCAEKLTQQLRRFSEKCLSDLVSYVLSEPKMAARIYSEKEKYHITVIREADGIRAEAVSKFNFPLMKDGTATALKQLGWAPPENESDNWTKRFSGDRASSAAADDLAKALGAYGLTPGEAISLTVGADVSGG